MIAAQAMGSPFVCCGVVGRIISACFFRVPIERNQMEERTDSIIFENEEGEEVSFFVIEQTMLAGVNYLLVAESGEDEAEAYILREIEEEDGQTVYEMVEEEEELEALSKIFSELLDDVEIER